MKTRHIPNPATAPSNTRVCVHAFMAIVGVLIAIVCALILLQDAPVLPDMGTSKASIGQVSKFTSMVRMASSWRF
jgi:hypothetical protein